MPENEVYMQKISETLATVAAKVQQDSSANLVSTNVLAENFYREFLIPLGERVFFFFLRVMFYAAEIFRSSS